MKIDELKKFAITLLLLPVVPAFVLYKHNMIKAAIIVLCIFWLISIVCFLSKSFARRLKDIITAIGAFLGRYIAIVVLFIGYIAAVIPTGFLMKIVKRDRLKLKKQNVETYWIDNESKNTDYEYQF